VQEANITIPVNKIRIILFILNLSKRLISRFLFYPHSCPNIP
jgi:hypothetical protein